MAWGRMVAGTAASFAVGGCAVIAVGMSSAGTPGVQPSTPAPSSDTTSSRPAILAMSPAAMPSASARASSATTSVSAASPTSAAPSGTQGATSSAATTAARATVHTTPRPVAAPRTSARPAPRPAALPRGQALPLHYSTGTATRVITVTASSTHSTTATLQAWAKAAGGGWLKYGSATTAHVGSDGLSTSPSESKSATPIGSFTLTQAFGHYSDPGTSLPYIHTNSADWWISQSGPLYNTHQHCSSGCAFTRGSPNEHLYYEIPYYNYAVVIDYNTRNAPGGVRQGAGSAFFLHVTDGYATAGCVAISQTKLVSLMRWLTPSAHPRIVIGVG